MTAFTPSPVDVKRHGYELACAIGTVRASGITVAPFKGGTFRVGDGAAMTVCSAAEIHGMAAKARAASDNPRTPLKAHAVKPKPAPDTPAGGGAVGAEATKGSAIKGRSGGASAKDSCGPCPVPPVSVTTDKQRKRPPNEGVSRAFGGTARGHSSASRDDALAMDTPATQCGDRAPPGPQDAIPAPPTADVRDKFARLAPRSAAEPSLSKEVSHVVREPDNQHGKTIDFASPAGGEKPVTPAGGSHDAGLTPAPEVARSATPATAPAKAPRRNTRTLKQRRPLGMPARILALECEVDALKSVVERMRAQMAMEGGR